MRPAAILALVAAAGWSLGGGPAAAQEVPPPAGPDTLAPARPDTVVRRAAPPRPVPRVAFSVTVGTLGFGDLQTQPVRATALDADGLPTDSTVLERRLAAEDGLQVGVAALVSLTSAWAVRAGATLGRATLAGGYDGEAPFEGDARGLAPAASDDLTFLALEAALRFRPLSNRRLQPWVELGGAGVRVTAEDPAFPGAAELDGDIALAALAGVGALVPLWGPVSGAVSLTAQLLRTPAGIAPAGGVVAAGDTLVVRFLAPDGRAVADPGRELLRVTRLDLGLSVGLGGGGPRAARAGRPSGSPP